MPRKKIKKQCPTTKNLVWYKNDGTPNRLYNALKAFASYPDTKSDDPHKMREACRRRNYYCSVYHMQAKTLEKYGLVYHVPSSPGHRYSGGYELTWTGEYLLQYLDLNQKKNNISILNAQSFLNPKISTAIHENKMMGYYKYYLDKYFMIIEQADAEINSIAHTDQGYLNALHSRNNYINFAIASWKKCPSEELFEKYPAVAKWKDLITNANNS
jgi:hypothetical protein